MTDHNAQIRSERLTIPINDLCEAYRIPWKHFALYKRYGLKKTRETSSPSYTISTIWQFCHTYVTIHTGKTKCIRRCLPHAKISLHVREKLCSLSLSPACLGSSQKLPRTPAYSRNCSRRAGDGSDGNNGAYGRGLHDAGCQFTSLALFHFFVVDEDASLVLGHRTLPTWLTWGSEWMTRDRLQDLVGKTIWKYKLSKKCSCVFSLEFRNHPQLGFFPDDSSVQFSTPRGPTFSQWICFRLIAKQFQGTDQQLPGNIPPPIPIFLSDLTKLWLDFYSESIARTGVPLCDTLRMIRPSQPN